MKPEDTKDYVKFTCEDVGYLNHSKEGVSVITDTYLSVHSPKGKWFETLIKEALKQQKEMLNKWHNS